MKEPLVTIDGNVVGWETAVIIDIKSPNGLARPVAIGSTIAIRNEDISFMLPADDDTVVMVFNNGWQLVVEKPKE